jgi:hypothetical protein
MPIRKKLDIGFNRRVCASWLNEALRLTAADVVADEIETSLKEQIALENQGKETVRKVFTYLNRIWIKPPDYCMALRDEALEMFRHRPDIDSAFLLNWGMCMAAYPFIAHVAEATGRLIRLQGEALAPQVNVRIRERFGDRHFVYRSIRYNLSTFLESGALQAGKKQGIYLRGRIMKPRNAREIAWIVEALLHSQDDTNLSLPQIAAHGALFPIDLADLNLATLKTNIRLEIFRHGLSENLIGLRCSDVESKP